MRPQIICIALILVMTGCAQSMHAEPVFSDDFQDGDADGWGAGGDGEVKLTTYQGNVSMRLTKRASSFAAITTKGYRNVRITANLAADDLEKGDACIAETSVDDGATWQSILRVEDGQDDAVTLHSGALSDSNLDDAARVIIRARVAGNGDNDTCWFDNVAVTGDWIADMPVIGSGLDADFLTGNSPMTGPVGTDAFVRPIADNRSTDAFEGRFVFTVQKSDARQRVLLDAHNYDAPDNPRLATLPRFDFDLVSQDWRLLPVQRGLITTEHPFWDYVLTPGRVWKAEEDKGWNRAALPFALIEKNANCTHNGLLTFLYKADGSVSRVAYQIGSETCAYFKFDAWGTASARYAPQQVPASKRVKDEDQQALMARQQVRAIETLEDTYPGLVSANFGSAQDIDPDNMTAYGLVVNGVHYVSGCQTRFGSYHYCNEMVLPSFSVAKSLFGALALMRLEQLYPGAKDALIKDYVPECAAASGWADVNFEHALDMATGLYRSTKSNADEDAALSAGFFATTSHADKIRHACKFYDYRAAPGKVWAYHTSDTYLLGTAMQAYLRERKGPQSDIYQDLLVDPIWKPLGLSATLNESRRTPDTIAQPFTGWGLLMQRGDLARLLQFTGQETGKIGAQSMLNAHMLAGAKQQSLGNTGLPAGAKNLRYNNGFWAWNYQDYGQCDAPIWVPFMSGYGGLSAVIIPNGVSYYYISDGYAFKFARAVQESEKIRPICRSAK